MVPAKGELVTISCKMPFAHMMKSSHDTTLEQGEVGLHGVRVDTAGPGILQGRMVHRMMAALILLPDPGISIPPIRVDRSILADVFADRAFKLFPADALDRKGSDLARTGHEGDYGHLALSTFAESWAKGPILVLSTHVRFVHLDLSAKLGLDWVLFHRISDAMAHEPRALVGDSDHTVKLMSRESLF